MNGLLVSLMALHSLFQACKARLQSLKISWRNSDRLEHLVMCFIAFHFVYLHLISAFAETRLRQYFFCRCYQTRNL